MNYNKEVKNAFDDWAETYESDVVPKLDLRGYSYSELASMVLSYYKAGKNNDPILELGVGTGVLGKQIKGHMQDIQIDGLDISSEMLKKAKEKQIYNELYLSSADEYMYEKKRSFIYSAFMFHSVKEQALLLEKTADALDHGGMFILVDLVPNMKILGHNSNFNAHSVQYEHGAPAMYKTCSEMITLIENSPFVLVELKQLGVSKDYNHYLFALQKE